MVSFCAFAAEPVNRYEAQESSRGHCFRLVLRTPPGARPQRDTQTRPFACVMAVPTTAGEGAVTSGVLPSAVDDARQAKIVDAGYGR